MDKLLKIKNLCVSVEEKEVLKGIDLDVSLGEVHAIMGPNGSGKSTLAKVVAGHPTPLVTGGEIQYAINRRFSNLLEMAPHERAAEGIFLGFQYPVEIPGISNFDFLRESFNAVCTRQGASSMDEDEFRAVLRKKLPLLGMESSFLDRSINVGFSGGEKKKNEILQMAVLEPRLAFLDETDSGLDIDALKVVSEGINALKSKHNAVVLVTHYQRILNHIVPDKVHVIYGGQIIKSGDKDLALEIEERGYHWITKQ